MNILILEDDRDLHRYYQSVCKASENVKKCITVSNAREFAYAMERHDIHLIISDIQMQPTDGDVILKAHKAEIKSIPIILLSCCDKIKDVRDDLVENGLNVVDYLQKPLRPEALYEIIG